MRIRRLIAHVVRLQLKRPFRHASAARTESDNVIMCCELENGTAGWGEGVPRPYVTGETPESCLSQLAATPVGEQLKGDCLAWPDVVDLCQQFQPAVDCDDPRGCYGNALRCAVELSILDAFGREFGEPISRVTGHFAPAQPIHHTTDAVRYGAVIDSGRRGLRRKALVRRLFGFRDCKIKVGTAGDDDEARLRVIRRWIGRHIDLRIDANEAWHAAELATKLRPLLAFGISSVEQPLPHAEVEHLSDLRKSLGVAVMLDESLTSMRDAQSAIAGRTCDLFNIRLSKCGGFLNSLRIAAAARAAGLGYQLGCHPGESGILSAAGRQWATSVAHIRHIEGSYDRFLFRQLLTDEDMTFGYAGRAHAIEKPGLGVTVNQVVLGNQALVRREFCVE